MNHFANKITDEIKTLTLGEIKVSGRFALKGKPVNVKNISLIEPFDIGEDGLVSFVGTCILVGENGGFQEEKSARFTGTAIYDGVAKSVQLNQPISVTLH